MLITVRAYRHTDLDLMLLKDAMGKNFSGFIRECLRCYLRGVPLRAGIPDIPFVRSELVTDQMKPTGVMLKDSEDADVIAMLKNIRLGYRNNFVKNIVRMYTIRHCIAAYADNETCYAMLLLPQEVKLSNTTILPIPEQAPVEKKKSEFVPKPKYVPETPKKPVPQPVTEIPANVMPAAASPVPVMENTSSSTDVNETQSLPKAEDLSWGAEDVVQVVEEEVPATASADSDAEMDILNMFAGMLS